ncbi:MAG: hypothetical protein GY838_08465 [bacterium]|nr:hypothetical protein [bacterium]
MNDDRKLWVIEDNEEPVITSLGDVFEEAPAPEVPRPAAVRRPTPQAAPRRPVARQAVAAQPRVHSAILLVLGYVLGPAALTLTERGRRDGLWVGLAMVTAAGLVAVVAGWWTFLRGEAPAVLLPAMVLGGVLTVATAATVWSRGLHLLLTARRFPTKPWPSWLKNPWTALATGLAAPGSALAIARRPRLAALTAWWTWPGAAALLLLIQAPIVWHHREAFGRWGIGTDTLEIVGVVATVVLAASFAFWVSQALLGARELAKHAGRWQSSRGDWTGVGLAAAVLVFVVVVQPGPLAGDLAVYASALADAECRVIPVGLNAAAQQLDPGQPAYALQGADLYAARGDLETARGMRGDLQRRMRPYLGVLAAEPEPRTMAATATVWPGDRPSPLVRPAAGVEPSPPSGTMAPPRESAPATPQPAAAALYLFGPVLMAPVEDAAGQEAVTDTLP